MKKIIGLIFILNFTFAFSQSVNSEAYRLTITGVASSNIEESKNKEEKNIIYSGGFLIEDRIEEALGIESGILLVNRQYDFKKNDFRIVEEVQRLHIPITARFWPGEFISFAFGPFLEISTSNSKVILINGKNPKEFQTSAKDSIEFGIDLALSFNVEIAPTTSFLLESRYSQIAGLQEGESINSLSALAGIQMAI